MRIGLTLIEDQTRMLVTKITKKRPSRSRRWIGSGAGIAGLALALQTVASISLTTQSISAKTIDKPAVQKDTADGSLLDLGVIEEASLDDPARNKNLALKITYPKKAGKFPLI